jgi:hypothetical protein
MCGVYGCIFWRLFLGEDVVVILYLCVSVWGAKCALLEVICVDDDGCEGFCVRLCRQSARNVMGFFDYFDALYGISVYFWTI